MIVRPEEISASSAPSARPLKSWETKLGQLIMKDDHGHDLQTAEAAKTAGAAGQTRLPAAPRRVSLTYSRRGCSRRRPASASTARRERSRQRPKGPPCFSSLSAPCP